MQPTRQLPKQIRTAGNPLAALRQLMMLNDQVFHWQQAEQLGVPWHHVRGMVRRGEVVPVHRAVYRSTASPPGFRQRLRAALLASGDAVVSHASAADLMGMPGVARGRPEITVIGPGRPRIDSVRIHRSRELPAIDRTRVRGLRCTTAPRTIIDLAGRLTAAERLTLVDEAVWGQVCNRRILHQRALELRGGRRGVPDLVAATAPGADVRFRSELERRFGRLCAHAELPRPMVNAHRRIQGRTLILDCLWLPQKVVVELLGLRFHDTPDAIERDARRTNLLVGAGYLVLVFTWRQVLEEPEAVVAEIARALRTSPDGSGQGVAHHRQI